MKQNRMIRRSKTIKKNTIGQSMVEFALILPLMVMLAAGIFDLGRAFYTSITITNAGREGARYGTLHPNDQAGMRNAVVREAQNSGVVIDQSDVTISCPDEVAPSGCDRSQPIRVTIDFLYDEMIFRFLFRTGIQMQRHVEMQVP